MKPRRFWLAAPSIGAVAVLLSCMKPGPAAPDLSGPWLDASHANAASGLVQCRPLTYDSVTQMVGLGGADLRVSRHTLSIPPQALSHPTRITLVAPPDTVNRIQLQPEGLVFELPVTLTMSYVNCRTDGSTSPKRVAYTDDALTILEYEPSVDDALGKKVAASLTHFSTYAVSW